jgi:L-histidine N-alpha-methyltransferase
MHSYESILPRLTIEASLWSSTAPDFAADTLQGLSANPKWLNPMYFYDAEGSRLFERICELPEYYVTRTERGILEKCAGEIAAYSLGSMSLVEFGSGSSAKTRLLIESLISRQGALCYTPIDISSSILVRSSYRLLEDYPQLSVAAQIADYDAGLAALMNENPSQKLIVFMGSNLGNFDPARALDFLSGIRRSMAEHDYLVIGNDLAKDASLLIAAYDDSRGITAAFNLNLLHRINRELGGTFDISRFDHLARYNGARGRIEMHLKCKKRHTVLIRELGTSFRFEQGETIHTEDSYKYTIGQLDRMFRAAGLKFVRRWLDSRNWFSITLLGV